jgi:hypothetical protein
MLFGDIPQGEMLLNHFMSSIYESNEWWCNVKPSPEIPTLSVHIFFGLLLGKSSALCH